jgi:sterol desaturase/sphingolipid hydroxylase (fatty acid hydroxylase superfamily)
MGGETLILTIADYKLKDTIDKRRLLMPGQIIKQMFDTVLTAISKMSKTPLNYWAEFAVDIPLGMLLIFTGLRHSELDLPTVFLTIILGLFSFSIIEYSFHRWLMHGSVQIFAQGHHAHHVNPLGYDSLPFFLPALILLMLTGVFVLIMATSYAFLLTGTIALGYVTYGLSHFIIHHHRFQQHFARDWAANHHIHHHHPETNFGVTTPLWDILIGTRYVSDHIRI